MQHVDGVLRQPGGHSAPVQREQLQRAAHERGQRREGGDHGAPPAPPRTRRSAAAATSAQLLRMAAYSAACDSPFPSAPPPAPLSEGSGRRFCAAPHDGGRGPGAPLLFLVLKVDIGRSKPRGTAQAFVAGTRRHEHTRSTEHSPAVAGAPAAVRTGGQACFKSAR